MHLQSSLIAYCKAGLKEQTHGVLSYLYSLPWAVLSFQEWNRLNVLAIILVGDLGLWFR